MSTTEYRFVSAILRALGALFSRLPIVPTRVVLASPRHPRLEGNLRYLADALQARRPGLRPVVLTERYGYGWVQKLAYLGRAIRGMYYLRTARVFVVDNAYLPVHVGPHRAGTRVIQVWHAASAIKRFGVDTAIPPAEPERTFLHRYYDEVIVSSEAVRGLYARALRTPVDQVLALGTPRTDLFFDPAAMAAARARVLAAYPALAGRRVVLHAPTLRGRGPAKRSTSAIDPVRLRALLPDDHVLVLKGHPNVPSADLETAGYDVIVDSGADMNDLLVASDVLVTDYSSAVFEYALLRRPFVLLVGDLEAYARDPGVAVDVRDFVGSLATDTDSAAAAIMSTVVDEAAYDAFIERHVGACDGHSSERLAERIIGLLAEPQSTRV